jgi:hypothetical protein
MDATSESRVLSVEVLLSETGEETEAKAVVELRGERIGGWGRAKRRAGDPSVPYIGEELATARALTDLAHHLLEKAVGEIEAFEHRPVRVHG